jgi:hypothetical protein
MCLKNYETGDVRTGAKEQGRISEDQIELNIDMLPCVICHLSFS